MTVRDVLGGILFGGSFIAAAVGQSVVVPNDLANVEGGTSNSFPLGNISQNHRYQQVYAADQFASLSGPHRVVEVRFRPNATSTYPAWSSTAQMEVLLSTVTLGPDQLNASFAQNVGPDELLVLSGPVTYGTEQVGPAAPGPMDFDIVLTFQTPFVYDPAAGNLLLEIRRTSTTIGTNRFIDAQTGVGDSISRVYSSTAGATTGSVDSIGLVTMFIVEPIAGACYANCDGSTQEPILNVADFGCFLSKFAAGDPYANCDGSTQEPVLNVADFGCFLGKFAAGCP